MFIVDRDLRLVATGGANTLTGIPVKDLTGQLGSDLLSPDEFRRLEPAWRKALAGAAVHCEGRLREVDVEYWLQPVLDARGEVALVVATVQNVMERKRAERELQEERERLVRVLDGSSDGYGEYDIATGKCMVSRRWNEIAGRDPGLSSIGLDEWTALVHPGDLSAVLPELVAFMEGRAPRIDVEHRIRRPDGSWAWVRTRAKDVAWDGTGKPTRFAGTLTDITQHKRAADERSAVLAASEAKYRRLHESMMDGFVRVGMDGAILESNEVYRRMLGYGPEELAGLTYQQITPERWHDEEARIVRFQILARGYSDVYEKEYRRKDGSVFPVEIRAFLLREGSTPVGIWGIVRDLSEKRRLQEQVATASRLAAVGTLVSGLAHEINNPLAGEIASGGFAIGEIEDLLGRMQSDAPPDREALSGQLVEVLEALRDGQASGLRIARIVKDMAALGRPDARPGRTSLAEGVEQAIRWLPPSTVDRVRIRVEDSGPVTVAAPQGRLAQVVVNLIDNSASAMPEGRNGNVTVRIGPAREGRAFLEVEDDGAGIAPDVMERMFDPFFSTRRPGRGTGLGLSIVHSVVTEMDGTVTARSEPGKGATFRLEMPAVGQANAAATSCGAGSARDGDQSSRRAPGDRSGRPSRFTSLR